MSPRESEAVAVAADALDGAGDPAALVVELVAELSRRGLLPEREVAVAIARLIEAHPEGAEMVRLEERTDVATACRDMLGEVRGWVGDTPGGSWAYSDRLWRTVVDARATHTTREEAEAALFAAQPEPRAIVRSAT